MFKRNIYIMYIIALLQGMVFYGPIATLYRQAEGVSILEITIIESISLALCLLFELPWGVIADKIGYRRTMLICCGLYFVSKIIFWQATGFFGFLLERCLLSVVIAGLSGVDTSVLYLSCEKDKSQHVFGIYEGLGTAGLLFAAFIYSIAVGTNYKLAGFLTMISYGIAFVLAFFLQEVKAEEEINASAGEFISLLKETLANKYLLLFLIGIAVFNETHQTITVFLNQLQYVRAGISEVSMGYIYIAVTVIGLCGVFSAKVTDKIGKIELMRICYMAAILACISLAATNRAWLSVGGIIILRITFSLAQPLQTELQNEQITTVNRATALSINAVIIDSIGICTNVVFGALAKTNLILAFVFGAVLCTAGLVWFEVWRRGTKNIKMEKKSMFKDKVVVVTGGAHGIGECICNEFRKEGANVCVIDLRENDYFQGDLSDKETLERFVDKVITDYGHVDCLINNAAPLFKGITECSYDEFCYALNVGVTAAFYLTKLFMPYFAENASVVNISSSRDRMSMPETESYTAAKGGIHALTHALSVSLAGKVRVNSVSPGWIDLDYTVYEGADAVQHPAGRVGNPLDIANMVLFLCSEKAGFITGENICVDGGMTKLMIYHDDNGWKYDK